MKMKEKIKIRKMNKYVTTKSIVDQIEISEELTIEFQYTFYFVFNLRPATQKNVRKKRSILKLSEKSTGVTGINYNNILTTD